MKRDFLQAEIGKMGDAKDKADLEKIGAPPWNKFEQLVVLSRLLGKYKGSFYSLTPQQVNSAVEKTTDYSKSELGNIDNSMKKIWEWINPTLVKYQALPAVPEISVPVLFVQGKHDRVTPATLSKAYFDRLKAPRGKGWFDFEKSAHFPMYEEPEKFLTVLKDAAAK